MKLKIFIILAGVVLLFTNCNDVLDRPSLTTAEDDAYWTMKIEYVYMLMLFTQTSLWGMD